MLRPLQTLSLFFALSLVACGPAATTTPTSLPAATHTLTAPPTATDTRTPTPLPTSTARPTITPTYIPSLRARVITQGRLSCRRGPGAPFLYVYTFAPTANIELIGRMERSDWVLAQAIGGDNPCWVNGGPDHLEISGDPSALAPLDPHVVLAWSPSYGPLTGVKAARTGDQVFLSWHPLVLAAGDNSEQAPYAIEAWLCQDGSLVFEAFAAYMPLRTLTDESGCAEPSHAQIAGAEKHGYTPWVSIAWPPHPEND